MEGRTKTNGADSPLNDHDSESLSRMKISLKKVEFFKYYRSLTASSHNWTSTFTYCEHLFHFFCNKIPSVNQEPDEINATARSFQSRNAEFLCRFSPFFSFGQLWTDAVINTSSTPGHTRSQTIITALHPATKKKARSFTYCQSTSSCQVGCPDSARHGGTRQDKTKQGKSIVTRQVNHGEDIWTVSSFIE
jgi:hypothetical protein